MSWLLNAKLWGFVVFVLGLYGVEIAGFVQAKLAKCPKKIFAIAFWFFWFVIYQCYLFLRT